MVAQNSNMIGSVLLLAFHFPPENQTASARPHRFYKHLPRFRYNVLVVTASAQGGMDPQKNVVCVGDARGKWTHPWSFALRTLLKPFVRKDSLRWALSSYEAAARLISENRVCAIVSTSPPIISNVVAGLLKKRYGIPWLADFRDPIVGDPGRNRSKISRLRDAIVERWSFRHANIVIANTDAALETWKRRYPHSAAKMHVIWNGFDREDSLGPLPLPQRGYRLLSHVGGIPMVRHPGLVLSSLRRLVHRGHLSPGSFRVRLVGPLEEGWAGDPSLVEELVHWGCLEYDGKMIPKKEAEQAMATADSLLLLDMLESGATQVPAKIFEYVRIGRPILAATTRGSPAEYLLQRSGIRYCSIYPDDKAEDIDQKILHFFSMPTEPVVASEWFWKEFDAVPQTQHLASLIASVESCHRATQPCLEGA